MVVAEQVNLSSGKGVTVLIPSLGNVTTKASKSPSFQPQPTPTLKSDMYTTGRGGTGNMAKNDPQHPEEARRAQDVDVPKMTISEGVHHTGRGTVLSTSPNTGVY